MPFDCHGHPILLPAELECGFTAAKSIVHFHEVIAKLEPALKQICPHARHLPYRDDFIISDFVTFISRKSPKGKAYWELYDDGPRKYPFAHWLLISFMAHLQRPETKAKLKRRAQAIDTQLRKTRAAGRKRFNEVLNDPKGYKTRAPSLPPSAEPTPTAIIDDAKERARQIIQEAEKRAHKILAEAARSRAQTAATPSAGNPSQPVKETIQLMPLNLNPEGPSEPMIGWIRHDLRRGSQ